MKKRKIVMSLVMLAGIVLMAGCGSNKTKNVDNSSTIESTTEASKTSNNQEKLKVKWPYYQIEKDGKITGHMMGTIHIGKKAMYPFPNQVLEDLKNSQVFITEIQMSEMENPDMDVLMGALQAEKPLTEGMNEKSLAKYKKLLKDYGYTEEDVKLFNRFGVDQMFQAKILSSVDASYGVDMQLNAHAKKNEGQENVGLETVKEQYSMLQKMYDEPADVNEWVDTLVGKKEAKQSMDDLLQEYLDGKIFDYYVSAEASEMTQEQYDLMLVNRNKKWLETLPDYLESDNQSFIAVGAGHLPGEFGLVKLLEGKGYTLTLVENE